MYLKKIETVGFKSFAERVAIEFVPGVTAIVGPNGSGKSNIIDAVRWVLGEQSAKSLRGSKMEDIIFQGSDSRKALNVAEVTLLLDNGSGTLPLDYEEVSVTRRVYRSGESEFYINKQSCRLKDIIDLFMDSGLGREAFSIISQGKVEEILSSKAEERRMIFEEAAGVLKYKQRKKKSEYKLIETQENLNRIEDIIHEIESQIRPLEQQAETAKKYFQLTENLAEEEISLLVAEIEIFYDKWQSLKRELEIEKEKELELKTAIQKKEASLARERQTNQKLDDTIEKLQEELLLATEQLEKLEGRKRLYSERTKHLEENAARLTEQKQENELRIAELNEKLEIKAAELATLQMNRDLTKQKIKDIQEKLAWNEDTIFDQIENLKANYIELLNRQAVIKNESQTIEKQLNEISNKSKMQTGKFQDTLELRSKLKTEKEQAAAKLSEREESKNEKEKLIRELKSRIEEERLQFQEMQTELYQGYHYIEKLKSRKEMLEEMKEDFQGFFQGVKAILKARKEKKLDHIAGAIIELIDVPDEYITAIETVLGAQAQHIVVKDEHTARTSITWLKKTNNGRATFLPLNVIQERSVASHVLQKAEAHPGYIGIAADLVHTDNIYKHAVNHLMGHVIVTKTLKDANEIAGLTERRYRLVTLDGDVVNPGGSMSGGAAKKTNQSLFTRDKELEEIKKKLVHFEKQMKAFSDKVDSQKNSLAQTQQQLVETENTLTEEQEVLQQLQTENHELQMNLESLNANLSIYDEEKRQYKENLTSLLQRKSELEQESEEVKVNLAAVQEEIDVLTAEEKSFKENREKLQEAFNDEKLKLAKEEERFLNQLDRVNSTKESLDTLYDLLENCKNELAELTKVETREITKEDLAETIDQTNNEKLHLQETIRKKRAERAERTVKIEDNERELREEIKIHQKLVSVLQEKEVQVNRLDVELENRLNQLQTEYTITFEKARKDYEKAEDIDKAKAGVQKIKNEISLLGPVNTGAIEEFERISERYNFLTEQKNDLVQAKNTLYDVINELDDEMIQRFQKTFHAVKEEFELVFKELFGGGKAELKLTDEKNLLDTGVDIVAQPPGKKLQHLGLLSGGERALTAISLLFAILRVRPVPFCILDEVEAALDEANVVRFAKYVKRYSEKTQFIVITHRKGTMEEADVLYGVTMQESGVSRLVSVKLEETANLT